VPASKGGARRVDSRTRTGVASGARPVADGPQKKRAPVRRKSISSIVPSSVAILILSITGAATRAVRNAAESSPANRAHTPQKRKKRPGCTGQISEDTERQGCGRDKPKTRLAIGAKIESDARAGRDRQPKKRAPKRRLRLESLFEKLEEKRESDGELSERPPALPRRPPAIAVSDTPAMRAC